jgi:glycerol-3-phosphate dehydrogenase
MANLGEAFPRPYRRPERAEHREIVCFCERVTRGEIADALGSPVPPADLDGLRRRTRALMGRCQGFFCGAEVARLMADGRA